MEFQLRDPPHTNFSDNHTSKGNEKQVNKINNPARRFRMWEGTCDKELIQYAVMAGFAAVAAGSFMPAVASKIGIIFLKVGSVLTAAGS
jgi:pilus assembly protein Flp/PilA